MLRVIEGEPHVLLIRDPYSKWGLPKGHLEDGEPSIHAAVREVHEETGLVVEPGPLVATIDWFFRAEGQLIHKFCDFFAMSSQSGEAIPQFGEGITECEWLPLPDAADRLDYDNARQVVEQTRALLEERGSELLPDP